MVTARARPDGFETPKTSENNFDRKRVKLIYPYILLLGLLRPTGDLLQRDYAAAHGGDARSS
eukprot:11603373-Heterocapsa_arctica.AAC.1